MCLCTGGYESNRTMIANYCQLPYLYPRAAALNTGDGVVMGLKAGADLWHMSNISGLGFGYHAEGKVGASTLASGVASIKVGPAGGRFMNEDAKARHGRVSFGGAWNMTPMAMPAYLITDSTQIGTPLVAGFSEGTPTRSPAASSCRATPSRPSRRPSAPRARPRTSTRTASSRPR